MKKATFALGLFLGLLFSLGGVRAQNPSLTPLEFTTPTTAGAHTDCNVPASGQSALCLASDGVWISTNGAAFVQIGTATTTNFVKTVNGVAPGSTGNVTLTAAAPTVTTTVTAPTISAPAVTASGSTATVGAPTASAPTATSTATAPALTAAGS